MSGPWGLSVTNSTEDIPLLAMTKSALPGVQFCLLVSRGIKYFSFLSFVSVLKFKNLFRLSIK